MRQQVILVMHDTWPAFADGFNCRHYDYTDRSTGHPAGRLGWQIVQQDMPRQLQHNFGSLFLILTIAVQKLKARG